jgi:hypothetical protein
MGPIFQRTKIKSKLIQQTDKEIDDMVYELYGLSEKEIGVVEGKKITTNLTVL